MKFNLYVGALALSSTSFIANAGLTKLEIEFDALSNKASTKINMAQPSDCSFNMLELSDDRQNKETVAFAFPDSIAISNIEEYLEKVKETSNGFTIDENAQYKVDVNARLIRMYTYPESMNILGITAIVADFMVNGEIVKSRQYRGFYAKTNWAGGKGEYLTAINDSAQELIKSYTLDLTNICNDISS
jgi:hypothetical protein